MLNGLHEHRYWGTGGGFCRFYVVKGERKCIIFGKGVDLLDRVVGCIAFG